jgi:MFS family permease
VGILGRFVGGWLLDRIDARFVFMLGIAGYIVGSVLATHIGAANVWLAFTTAACYGWGFGCSWISFHTITGNFFGVAAYPKLNGTLMILSGLVCAPAGIVGGKLFDTYHSYAPAFHLNLMISVVGILALSFAKMPVHPESVPDAKTETWCAGQQERLRAALCGSEVSNGR